MNNSNISNLIQNINTVLSEKFTTEVQKQTKTNQFSNNKTNINSLIVKKKIIAVK